MSMGAPVDGEGWFCYDMDGHESGVEATVNAVASVTSEAPVEMTPLYHVIEEDTLEVLMASSASNDGDMSVRFSYNGCDIIVKNSNVYVRKADT